MIYKAFKGSVLVLSEKKKMFLSYNFTNHRPTCCGTAPYTKCRQQTITIEIPTVQKLEMDSAELILDCII